MSGPIYASLWIRRPWPALFNAPFFWRGGIKSLVLQKNYPIVTAWDAAFSEIPFAIITDLFWLAGYEAAEVGDPCQTH